MFPVNLQASISIIYRYRYPINGSNDHINRRIGSEDQWNIFWMQKKRSSQWTNTGNCACYRDVRLFSDSSEIQDGYYNQSKMYSLTVLWAVWLKSPCVQEDMGKTHCVQNRLRGPERQGATSPRMYR